jgi:putative redox protein
VSTLTARVTYVDGLQFVGEGGSGHAVVMDGVEKFGGRDTGLRPTELILIGLGGCSGMDVISVLKKKRQDVTGLDMHVSGTKREGHPSKIEDMVIRFTIRGRGVSEEAVKRAITLSMEKYCSVKSTLEEEGTVDFTYRIEEETSSPE